MTPEELGEYVARKAREDPKTREIVHDVRMYEGLKDHAGWRHLRKKIEAQTERAMGKITQRMLRGEIVDQREIDMLKGWVDCARFIFERPDVAEDNLELAARMAYLATLDDLVSEEEEASPYA